MSDHSAIEWTDATWNPVRGCTKVSAGCKNCYAEVFAERWRGVPGHPYEQGFDLRLVPEKLLEPLSWKRPRRVFVNSMSDLFQDGVPIKFIKDVFKTMRSANWHTFQILTKRPERMQEVISKHLEWVAEAPHIWIGVSVENRKQGLPRIKSLRKTPAAVRFLSIEPLLEDLGTIDLKGIHWVIVGGESGPHSRPMEEKWVSFAKTSNSPGRLMRWLSASLGQTNLRVLDRLKPRESSAYRVENSGILSIRINLPCNSTRCRS